ncbi:hypothetical protein FB451DRAFT_1183023 [Mycena latifolia]|nr:hypothetical protein FB451DRAFT_1183023 [Mycena latifolia]
MKHGASRRPSTPPRVLPWIVQQDARETERRTQHLGKAQLLGNSLILIIPATKIATKEKRIYLVVCLKLEAVLKSLKNCEARITRGARERIEAVERSSLSLYTLMYATVLEGTTWETGEARGEVKGSECLGAMELYLDTATLPRGGVLYQLESRFQMNARLGLKRPRLQELRKSPGSQADLLQKWGKVVLFPDSMLVAREASLMPSGISQTRRASTVLPPFATIYRGKSPAAKLVHSISWTNFLISRRDSKSRIRSGTCHPEPGGSSMQTHNLYARLCLNVNVGEHKLGGSARRQCDVLTTWSYPWNVRWRGAVLGAVLKSRCNRDFGASPQLELPPHEPDFQAPVNRRAVPAGTELTIFKRRLVLVAPTLASSPSAPDRDI